MSRPKIAVVGIPGKWSTETLADEVHALTGFRLVVDMGKVALDLARKRLAYGARNLLELDALIVKKISERYSPDTLDRLELLRAAQAAGVRIFSAPENMLRLVDRLSCTITLANGNVPMPETFVTEDPEQAFAIVEKFGEAVFKPLYSTKARGMRLLRYADEADMIRDSILEFRALHPVMYIQKRAELPGQDLGLAFLGGEYLGAYARVAGNAWNTTINSGGRYLPYQPPASVIDIARRAQALFGLDFTTVDVAETTEGPVVFEVSAFGGFRGAKEGIGINVAELYTRYVIERLESSNG